MDIAARLQEEVDRYNSLVEQRDTLSQQFQATVSELQATFGRIQILNELTEGEQADVPEPDAPEPAPAPEAAAEPVTGEVVDPAPTNA